MMTSTIPTRDWTFTLQPKELGRISIELIKDDHFLVAQFHVDTQEAKDTIESSLVQLRESLEAQGVKINDIHVAVNREQLPPPGYKDEQHLSERSLRQDEDKSGNNESDLEQHKFNRKKQPRYVGYNTMEFVA